MLKGAELVCYKDGGLIETVGLRGCAVKPGKVCKSLARFEHRFEFLTLKDVAFGWFPGLVCD